MSAADVLFLDPQALRAKALARWLRAEGLRVQVCQSMSEALDALGEAVPQLLLLAVDAPVDAILQEVAAGGVAPVPVCVVGATVGAPEAARWLEGLVDDAVGDPLEDPLEAARLRAVLRRSAQLAVLREDVERTRFVLRLAGTWNADEDFEGRIRGLAPALQRLPAVAGYELALLRDPRDGFDVVASFWPDAGSKAWSEAPQGGDGVAAGLERWAAASEPTVRELAGTPTRHELLVPVSPGGAGLGVLRILLQEGHVPSAVDQAFYGNLGRVLGANLAVWRSMQGLELRQGRLESAFVARFQELRAAQRRMEQLNRMKDDFLGVATHDLKGPLSVILGQGQLLDRGFLGPLTEKQGQAAAAILRQASRIRGTVDELRLRAQRGTEVEARRENVDLVQIVDRSLERVLSLARGREVVLERSVSVDELMHFGDPVLLRQALGDLLQRAVEGSPPGAEVLCALRQPTEGRRRIDLVVEGGGAAAVGEDAADAIRGGDALLTACRSVAREHGGQLWIEASARGSRVTLSLPVPLERFDAARPGRARVVLVQPDPDLAEAALRALASRFEVQPVAPEHALSALQEHAPDALVLGVGAADAQDSLALLDSLRVGGVLERVPLVVHSALPQEELAGHLAGVAGWTAVAAPAAGRTLLRAVEAVLEGRRGPPLELPAFLARLRRRLTQSADSGHPVAVLRIRAAAGIGPARLARLARWLEPRTRTADRLGLADPQTLLLQLPGAPGWVPERIAGDLLEAIAADDADLLEPGDTLAWVAWEPGDDIDGPEELLARLDEPGYRRSLQVPAAGAGAG